MYLGVTMKGNVVVFQAVNGGKDYPDQIVRDRKHLLELIKPFADEQKRKPENMTLFKEPGFTYPKWARTY